MDFADISSHQAGTDLAAYAAAGHDRILLKATEGLTYTNPYFAGWWRRAGQLGLARGAYHYALPSTCGGTEAADRFLAVVQAAGGVGSRDWLTLDAEDPAENGPKAARYAVDFCRHLEALGHPAGHLYSGTWYLQPAGITAAMLPAGWRRLHLANYSRVPDMTMPLPACWNRDQVVVRQYTSTARQSGIPGPSDRNRVLHEWLAPASAPREGPTVVDVELSPVQLEAVADTTLAKAWEQATDRPPNAPDGWYPPKQRHIGDLLRRTYEVVGRIVTIVTAIARDVAAVRAAMATMVDPSHPAADILTTAPAEPVVPTVAGIVAAVETLDMAGAVRVAHAATARAVAHIPTELHPEETLS